MILSLIIVVLNILLGESMHAMNMGNLQIYKKDAMKISHGFAVNYGRQQCNSCYITMVIKD